MDVRDVLKSANLKPALKSSLKRKIERPQPMEALNQAAAKLAKKELAQNDEPQSTAELELAGKEKERIVYDKITANTVGKFIHLLEKRVLANQAARTKFPDEPEKFMDSEIELQETLDEMQVLAAEPSLYKIMAEYSNFISLLLSLFQHENTDMSVSLVELFYSLFDSTGLLEAELSDYKPFIDVLLENQFILQLSQNMLRLNESNPDEAEGLFKSIGIIENLIEVRDDIFPYLHSQDFFSTMLKQLKRRTFDKVKLYASELLATILLSNPESCKTFSETHHGVDLLLQQLALYKRHDPNSREEAEMLQNLFSALCTCLMYPKNKQVFLLGEGIQLMNLMLRERCLARDTALRVLDYALSRVSMDPVTLKQLYGDKLENTTEYCINSCNKFVECLGLRSIFPLFMHCPKAKVLKFPGMNSKKKNETISKASNIIGPTTEQMEEHIISILNSLLRFTDSSNKSRVLQKFVENDHEKVERLIELHISYQEKISKRREKNQALKQQTERWEGMEPEEIEDELELKLIENGLLTLQMVDLIIMIICVEGQETIMERVTRILTLHKHDTNEILKNCQHYQEQIENYDELDEENDEKKRVASVILNFEIKLSS